MKYVLALLLVFIVLWIISLAWKNRHNTDSGSSGDSDATGSDYSSSCGDSGSCDGGGDGGGGD